MILLGALIHSAQQGVIQTDGHYPCWSVSDRFAAALAQLSHVVALLGLIGPLLDQLFRDGKTLDRLLGDRNALDRFHPQSVLRNLVARHHTKATVSILCPSAAHRRMPGYAFGSSL